MQPCFEIRLRRDLYNKFLAFFRRRYNRGVLLLFKIEKEVNSVVPSSQFGAGAGGEEGRQARSRRRSFGRGFAGGRAVGRALGVDGFLDGGDDLRHFKSM